MPSLGAKPVTNNQLLDRLPKRLGQGLRADCELVQLLAGESLGEPESPIGAIYFPSGSYISLSAPVAATTALEVALVGREGMLGLPLLLGSSHSSLRAVVRGAGPAWRLPTPQFRRLLRAQPVLRRQLEVYACVVFGQLAQSAVCASFHPIEARLARWLLMADDRGQGQRQRIQQTHAQLAALLGVRRSGVTTAAGELQRRQLIRYSRGGIRILDRPGLQQAACDCYQRLSALYTRLLP